MAFLSREPEPAFSLIETLLLEQGSYALLEGHVERMAASAAYFGMAFAQERVQQALAQAAEAWRGEAATRVRLLMDRAGQVSWTASPLEGGVEGSGLDLVLVPERTEAGDRFLRHKTTQRTRYDDALQEAQLLGFADALFCNSREELTEGAIHNIAIALEGQWWTPPLACGVLPGVYRRRMLEQQRVRERVIRLEDLCRAEAVSVCNSVRGLRPVVRISALMRDGRGPRALWTGTRTGVGGAQ